MIRGFAYSKNSKIDRNVFISTEDEFPSNGSKMVSPWTGEVSEKKDYPTSSDIYLVININKESLKLYAPCTGKIVRVDYRNGDCEGRRITTHGYKRPCKIVIILQSSLTLQSQSIHSLGVSIFIYAQEFEFCFDPCKESKYVKMGELLGNLIETNQYESQVRIISTPFTLEYLKTPFDVIGGETSLLIDK